jgi:ribose 5-phosphate isomerase B
MKKIAIGSDHAGFGYKEAVKEHLTKNGFIVTDLGTFTESSCDYPDYAHAVANAVEQGVCEKGVLICGSANGVAITANKHAGIRAALCWEKDIAILARAHNDANIICIPARFVSTDVAFEMTDAFFSTEFEGGRHAARVGKI